MTPADQHRRAWLVALGHELPPTVRLRVTCAGPDCLLSHSPQTYSAAPDAIALEKAHRALFGPSHKVVVEEVRG